MGTTVEDRKAWTELSLDANQVIDRFCAYAVSMKASKKQGFTLKLEEIMATTIKKSKMKKIKDATRHLVEELEDDFHKLQSRINKARDSYVSSHEKELNAARKKIKSLQKEMAKAKVKAAKATLKAQKSGSKKAKNQLKKARAATLLLGESLSEAKLILSTRQDKLQTAKPFDRKLAARAKVLQQFEKDWAKKLKAEADARVRRAALAAARRKQAAAAKKL